MNNATPEIIAAYLVGDLDAEQRRDFEDHMSVDGELAAKVEVLRSLLGRKESALNELIDSEREGQLVSSRPVRGWHRRIPRRLAYAAAVILVVVALGAGWALLFDDALLRDTFQDDVLDGRNWRPLRPIVREEDGHLRLLDRGLIVSNLQFKTPLELELDWRPLDLAGDALYLEVLTIALRTSGAPRTKWNHEASDGVLVKFDAQGGTISASLATAESSELSVLGHTPSGSVTFAADQWYHLRITDDGAMIRVFVSGDSLPDADPDSPVLEVRHPSAGMADRISIYNRERVANVPHESHIDNVVVRELRLDDD